MRRNRIMAIALAVIIAINLLPGVVIAAETVIPAINNGDIVIMYTNDIHCGVEQVKDNDGNITNIGYAGVSAFKKYAEEIAGAGNVTLVDAGDALQGDAVGTMSKGEYIVDIMNAVGYDIFVPGNHEFDYGMGRMQELMGLMNAKVISSNFIDLKTGAPVFNPWTMLTYGDTKVAYIGVTTPESFTKSTPAYFQDADGNYIYGLSEKNSGKDLFNTVQSAVDAALAEGADFVIAVGHLGIDELSAPWRSTDVIANTYGIDAFIDGHSHSTVASRSVQNKNGSSVILTQTGTKLANIGCMTISADGVISAGLVSGYAVEDNDTQAFVDGILASLETDLAEVVAVSSVDLTVNDPLTGTRMVRSCETNLGDLCADAYRYVLGNGKTGAESGPADIAFVNGGGIRENIPAGDVSFGQVIAVHPFNNVGCVVEATGQQIIDALEMASRSAPSELGGFLQVSGLTYVIDLSTASTVVTSEQGEFISIAGERRVRDVLVGGKPIDLSKTYTLASHNYMLLDGGDGLNMFRNNNIVVQPVILDNKVLITYIEEYLGGVVGSDYANPYGQGRIRVFDSMADYDGSIASGQEIPLMRGMLAVIIYSAVDDDVTIVSAIDPQFTDVSGNASYSDAVAWAAGAGIMRGYGGGLFGPDDPVTREQLATILLRYAIYAGKGPVGTWAVALTFADTEDISDYAVEGVMWCSIGGLLGGKSTDHFNPKGTVTRTEVSAAILSIQKRDSN